MQSIAYGAIALAYDLIIIIIISSMYVLHVVHKRLLEYSGICTKNLKRYNCWLRDVQEDNKN